MLYNSPRNDQPSAKTSQTSLTDLSLAIGTAYESIHTFVFSHEKSLIRDFLYYTHQQRCRDEEKYIETKRIIISMISN